MPSELTIDYFGLVREAVRKLGTGRVYYSGTVTVSSGTVTLTSGSFPDWAANAAINLNGVAYAVSARTSGTILVLVDTTVSAVGIPYLLMEAMDNDTTSLNDLDDLINNGYRQFLSEMIGENPPRPWSFLCPTTNLAINTNTQSYTLAPGTEFKTSEWVYVVSTTPYNLSQIPNGQLQAIKTSTVGKPRYFSIRPKATEGAVSQEYEVEFNCPPDASYSVSYTYLLQPNRLTPVNSKPVGAFGHSETIRAAVLSKVESFLDCTDPIAAKAYQELVTQSKMLDSDTVKRGAMSWPTATINPGTYEWICREAAMILGENPNYAAWDHLTAQRFDSWIQRGYRMFVQPEITADPTHRGHVWSFVRPLFSFVLNEPYDTGTITVSGTGVTLVGGTFPTWATEGDLEVENQILRVTTRTSGTVLVVENNLSLAAAAVDYRLLHGRYRTASSFQGIDGPLRYRPDTAATNAYASVRMTSYSELQAARYTNVGGSEPLMAAETVENVSGTAETRKVLEFWPYPLRSMQIQGMAKIQPSLLAPGEYVIGGPAHYDTVLAAVCAAADSKRWTEFTVKMAASINRDQSLNAPQNLPLNLNRDHGNWLWDLRRSQGPVYVDGTQTISRY